MYIDWEFLGAKHTLLMLLRIALLELKRGHVPSQKVRMDIALAGLAVANCSVFPEAREYMSRMNEIN